MWDYASFTPQNSVVLVLVLSLLLQLTDHYVSRAMYLKIISCGRHGWSGNSSSRQPCQMNIGSPINVPHVVHVTFDKFNGFLGLPDEYKLELPRSLQVLGTPQNLNSYLANSRSSNLDILPTVSETIFAKNKLLFTPSHTLSSATPTTHSSLFSATPTTLIWTPSSHSHRTSLTRFLLLHANSSR